MESASGGRGGGGRAEAGGRLKLCHVRKAVIVFTRPWLMIREVLGCHFTAKSGFWWSLGLCHEEVCTDAGRIGIVSWPLLVA